MKVIAISDQHGHLPDIPPCDLLVVGGDNCYDLFQGVPARMLPERQWLWFVKTWMPWRNRQPAKDCVVTWGNHDYCGLKHLSWFDMSKDGKRTIIACDQLVDVGGLKVYLTPWSNQFLTWAFMKEPAHLIPIYQAIPTGVDILVSHQPPKGCGDGARYAIIGEEGEHSYGSFELRYVIEQVRPKVVVCGHIHMGHGRHDCDGIPVYNVSVVDEAYKLVNAPTVVWDA